MDENVKVVVRIRPRNKKELSRENIKMKITDTSIDFENSTYTYDTVFDCCTQEDIYNVAKKAVDWFCQGYNATIFVYGATSSGKTYTMAGNEKSKGIIPRACEDIFSIINSNNDVIEAVMKCSFLEIYREHIRDLLDPSIYGSQYAKYNPDLKIRHNDTKGIYVQGLIEKHVYSAEEIHKVIENGINQRTVASTALNDESSRSHAVLTLVLTQTYTDGSQTISKLHLIDLAGSENVGRSEAQGVTLSEAQAINKSLSALGNVIFALTEKKREHIPYRDSKLTMLLQDSLGGNSKTILIATVSPSTMCYSETLSTLRFAHRAKNITNVPKINKNQGTLNLLKTIEELQKRISELEAENKDSKTVLESAQKETAIDTYLKSRNERLEKKISILENEVHEAENKLVEYKNIFNAQRDLAKKIAKDLYKEKVTNARLRNNIERYRMFHDSLKLASSLGVVKNMIDNTSIIESNEPVNIDFDTEIEVFSPI